MWVEAEGEMGGTGVATGQGRKHAECRVQEA
jgi:hypothetical protein